MADRDMKFSASHLADARFEDGGLRSFFVYRDLGIAAATGGKVVAHVIRAKTAHKADAGWHRHELQFQMYYVTRGWVEFEYEGVGRVRAVAGSCIHQPPGIRHREIAHSDDLELLEIALPAGFATVETEAPAIAGEERLSGAAARGGG